MSEAATTLSTTPEIEEVKSSKRPSRARFWMGRAAMAGGVGLYALGVTQQLVGVDPQFMPREIKSIVLAEELPPPPPEELARVKDVIAQPNHPEMSSSMGDGGTEFILERAEDQGLHLVDPRPYEDRLDQSESVDETEQILASFMAEYDMDVRMFEEKSADKIIGSFTPMERATTRPFGFKVMAKRIMRAMFILPKELVTVADIPQVIIGEELLSWDGSAADGVFNFFTRGVYFRADCLFPDQTLHHEIVHAFMQRHGILRSKRDPALQKLFGAASSPEGRLDEEQETYSQTAIEEMQANDFADVTMGVLWDLESDSVRQERRALALARIGEVLPTYPAYIRSIGSDGSGGLEE